MPLLRLDAETDDFSNIKIERGSFLVHPDPYLVRVITVSGQCMAIRGEGIDSQSSVIQEQTWGDQDIVEKLDTNWNGSAFTYMGSTKTHF